MPAPRPSTARARALRRAAWIVAAPCACSGAASSGASFPGTDAGAEGDASEDLGSGDGSSSTPPDLVLEAGASAYCKPGKYVGTYTGTYQMTIPTTGPVTITLTQSTTGNGEEILVTNGGEWDTEWGLGSGDATVPLVTGHATLVGQLNCANDQFSATAAPGSSFTILGVPSGSFTLTLSGSYDPSTESLGGTFSYTSNDGNGTGTWTTMLTP